MSRFPSVTSVFPRFSHRKPDAAEMLHARAIKFGLDVGARPDAQRIELALPMPPTLNNLFLNVAGRGRVPTPGYTAWLEEVAWIIAAAKPGRIGGKVEVSLAVGRPDARRRDLDNLLKAPIDAAVKNRLISDDSMVEKITARWTPGIRGVVMTITKFEGAS